MVCLNKKLFLAAMNFFLVLFLIFFFGLKSIYEKFDRPVFIDSVQSSSSRLEESIPLKIEFSMDGKKYKLENPEVIIDLWSRIRSLPYYTENTIPSDGEQSVTGEFYFLDNNTSSFILNKDLRIDGEYYGSENNPVISYFKDILEKISEEQSLK